MNRDMHHASIVSARIIGLTGAACLCLWSAPAWTEVRGQEPPRKETAAPKPSSREILSAMQDVFAEVIAKGEKSVVSIARVRRELPSEDKTLPLNEFQPFQRPRFRGFPAQDPTPAEAPPLDPDFIPNDYGTGVIIDRSGLILTNYHVLGDLDANDYYVTTLGQKRYPAKAVLKAADPRSDLAILKISVTEQLTPIEFGDAKKLKKGHFVISLGNPYAIAKDGQSSASIGHVANLSRKAPPLPTSADNTRSQKTNLHHFGTLIQTDIKLNMGTSGGPLLDLDGKMVGMVTSLAAIAGYEQSAGFAIPIDDTFLRIIDALKQGKEPGYAFLGISPENFAHEEREKTGVLMYSTPVGARIARPVQRGVPADQTRPVPLKERDIIVKVNETPIKTADDLMLHIGKLPVESKVRLMVLPAGAGEGAKPLPYEVTLAKFMVRGKQFYSSPEPPWRGMRVDFFTAVIDFSKVWNWGRGRGFGNNKDAMDDVLEMGCVAVKEVEEGSPAWKAGIRQGMLIIRVNDRPLKTPAEFKQIVEKSRDTVTLETWNQTVQIIQIPAK